MFETKVTMAAVVLAGILAIVASTGQGAPGNNALPVLTPVTADGVLDAVRASGGRAVLVNVWATWCQPCREEMPDLLRLRRELEGSGFRLILVSGDFDDQREAAQKFLAGLGVDFPSYIKNQNDMAFIDDLDPNWSGALPASFVFDGDGKLRDAWEGKRSYDKLRSRVLRDLDAREGTQGQQEDQP